MATRQYAPILVVDDDRGMRRLVAVTLRGRLAVEVVEADGAEAALSWVRAGQASTG